MKKKLQKKATAIVKQAQQELEQLCAEANDPEDYSPLNGAIVELESAREILERY